MLGTSTSGTALSGPSWQFCEGDFPAYAAGHAFVEKAPACPGAESTSCSETHEAFQAQIWHILYLVANTVL